MDEPQPIPRRRIPHDVSDDHPKPGFRWRIIPAWFLMIFGAALAGLFMLLILPLHFDPRNTQRHIRQAVAAILMCVAGTCWFLAGRAILTGHWKRLSLLLALGFACGALGAKLMWE